MTIDLYAIKREHGGIVYDGGRRWLGPGPGHSRRDTSLSVRIVGEGRAIVHSFSSATTWQEGAAHLGIEAAKATPEERAEAHRLRRERAEAERQALKRRMEFCGAAWGETVTVAGTPAERYLTSRGLVADPPPVLRYHPAAALAYEGTRRAPALVALVQNHHGDPSGLHVTALKADGSGKAPMHNARRMFGRCAGGSVQLAPFLGGDLAVAEGIETALAFAELNSIPTWAALSTSGLQTFCLPVGVRRLIIAADNDDGGAGVKAARDLAERASVHCEAIILAAPEGQDWADVLMEVAGG